MHHRHAAAPAHPLHRLAAALALAGLAPAAWAQAEEAGKLQTITVTAERRSENILEVPSSISTITPRPRRLLWPGGCHRLPARRSLRATRSRSVVRNAPSQPKT